MFLIVFDVCFFYTWSLLPCIASHKSSRVSLYSSHFDNYTFPAVILRRDQVTETNYKCCSHSPWSPDTGPCRGSPGTPPMPWWSTRTSGSGCDSPRPPSAWSQARPAGKCSRNFKVQKVLTSLPGRQLSKNKKLPEKSSEMMTSKILSAIMNKVSLWIREIKCVTPFQIDIFATRHPEKQNF